MIILDMIALMRSFSGTRVDISVESLTGMYMYRIAWIGLGAYKVLVM